MNLRLAFPLLMACALPGPLSAGAGADTPATATTEKRNCDPASPATWPACTVGDLCLCVGGGGEYRRDKVLLNQFVIYQGGTYMRPTIVLCDSFAHSLANREFLFPYASVLSAPQSQMLKLIGPSLTVSAITKDAAFRGLLLESPLIQRLNFGPIPTMKISWDQPHEGNLFEFLYQRRAIERNDSPL